jgi:AcrR family transcriptional regulator
MARTDRHEGEGDAVAAGARRAPGRPRSDASRQTILDAAIDLMRTQAYRDITVEGIAAAAKVGKQTIYRWWPSKADLVLEAYTERSLYKLPPDLPSGDVFADLEADLVRYFSLLRHEVVTKGVRSLVAEAQLDDGFRRKFYEAVWKRRCEAVHAILRRGVADGQIRSDVEIEAVAHLIHGASWYRMLSGTTRPFDAGYARTIVSLLKDGLASVPAPGATPSRPRTRRAFAKP